MFYFVSVREKPCSRIFEIEGGERGRKKRRMDGKDCCRFNDWKKEGKEGARE